MSILIQIPSLNNLDDLKSIECNHGHLIANAPDGRTFACVKHQTGNRDSLVILGPFPFKAGDICTLESEFVMNHSRGSLPMGQYSLLKFYDTGVIHPQPQTTILALSDQTKQLLALVVKRMAGINNMYLLHLNQLLKDLNWQISEADRVQILGMAVLLDQRKPDDSGEK